MGWGWISSSLFSANNGGDLVGRRWGVGSRLLGWRDGGGNLHASCCSFFDFLAVSLHIGMASFLWLSQLLRFVLVVSYEAWKGEIPFHPMSKEVEKEDENQDSIEMD